MDNSFDKLNNEFADKGRSGFKYWFWMIWSYLFIVLGAGFCVFGFLPASGGVGMYFNLLTLLCGLFGVQTVFWAKAGYGGAWTKPLRVSFVASMVVVVIACIVLYIVMPYVKG